MIFSPFESIFFLILLSALFVLSWIDVVELRLPDALTLPLIGIGGIQAWVLGTGWVNSLIGAIVGYTVFVVIETGFKHLRGQEGLGRGDAKLLAAGGAWCGWTGLPFIVLIASGLSLFALLFPSVRGRATGVSAQNDESMSANSKTDKGDRGRVPAPIQANGAIPFGPFLALGILIVWLSQIFAKLGLG